MSSDVIVTEILVKYNQMKSYCAVKMNNFIDIAKGKTLWLEKQKLCLIYVIVNTYKISGLNYNCKSNVCS